MSMPEEQPTTGILSGRIMGIPSVVWIGGIALIVYFLFFRNGGKTGGQGTAGNPVGGSGTITTGATTIDSGAVQVTVEGQNASPMGGQSANAETAVNSGQGASSTQSQPSPPTTGTATTFGSAVSGDLPAPTTGLSDTPYQTSVDLGWGAIQGAQQYHYQVLKGNQVVADAATSNLHAAVPGLSRNTAYRWRVSSLNPRGKWTNFINFRTK